MLITVAAPAPSHPLGGRAPVQDPGGHRPRRLPRRSTAAGAPRHSGQAEEAAGPSAGNSAAVSWPVAARRACWAWLYCDCDLIFYGTLPRS